jgi:multiple sugar transport system substrate-binding protein
MKAPEVVRDAEKPAAPEAGRGPSYSRRSFMGAMGSAGLALVVASCGGDDSNDNAASSTKDNTAARPRKSGLADGMIGGPTGFPGAERYQYPEDSPEGRAMDALRRLKQDGKAPDELLVQEFTGSFTQWSEPWPKGSQSLKQLFEEESGIKIKFAPIDPAQAFANSLRAAALRDTSFHVVHLGVVDIGELSEAGLLADLTEYVERYKPDYLEDPDTYMGGAPRVAMFNKYNGRYHAVTFDGDWQVWFYQGKFFDDKREQAAFEDRYGRALEVPKNWDEHAEVAEFFTRRDDNMFGDVSLKDPNWGAVNWSLRYVTLASPNQYYFDDDGSALIGSDAGIQALEEHRKALDYTFPDALAKSYPELFASFGNGTGAMGLGWMNLTKFVKPKSDLDKGTAGTIRSTIPPGRQLDGTFLQRSVLGDTHVTLGVNAFADEGAREAAYLLLQWAGGSRISTWYASNPAGFDDPHHEAALEDPLVRDTYTAGTMDSLGKTAPLTVPQHGAGMNGGHAYRDALDREIQNALSGQKSEAQAMQDAANAWERITDRLGRETQAAAVKENREAWPDDV